ncbi:Rpn family recombination-promoting nuclease/putative transposase [Treponema sp. TIM-1]|uniref:Rpn family recombination-promoting nuclease/putative transposase n=1 Tax=Treponema sp. TIM-1 TaxID=2898417 RepID=UPI00397EE150
MITERLNPLNDFLFVKIMGEKGDEEQLCAFLNAVLGRKEQDAIESVEILENKTITAEVVGDKTSILDVRARTASGERINIEVQLRNLGNMDRRSLFYWSLEFSRGMEAGQDYRETPNVIAINIVNYEFLPQVPVFHTSFHIWEDTYREVLLTDALEIHFIDMVKFRRQGEKDIRNDPLQRWLTWFDKDSPQRLVEEIIKMDTAIQKAEEKLVYVSQDKEALRAYQMREMALSDWTSGLNHAREEGIQAGIQAGIQEGILKGIVKGKQEGLQEGLQEGKQKGKQEGRREIASKMKKRGVPIDQIAEDTGLSGEEIEQL